MSYLIQILILKKQDNIASFWLPIIRKLKNQNENPKIREKSESMSVNQLEYGRRSEREACSGGESCSKRVSDLKSKQTHLPANAVLLSRGEFYSEKLRKTTVTRVREKFNKN
jgi:hypothetical protein